MEVDSVVFSPWQLVSYQENKKREHISSPAKPFDMIILLGKHNTKQNKHNTKQTRHVTTKLKYITLWWLSLSYITWYKNADVSIYCED